ncbi:MAG: hypothetical protein GX334_00930 [Firmicutes bacterium]|nr:hypothetical protein [Bacillota bacterium]
MEILTTFIRIALFVFIAAAICLLCVPFKYKIDGEFDRFLVLNFSIFCTPLCGIRGCWTNAPGKSLQVQVAAAGLPFKLNLKEKVKNKKEKEKEKEKEKKGKGKGFPVRLAVLSSLDKEFIGNLYVFLKDVLKMLKPKEVTVGGRIGFSEPHYNGWLSALIGMLHFSKVIRLGIETVWEEECYEFSFVVAGKVIILGLLFRTAQFLLRRRTWELLKTIRQEKALSAAGTIF